MRSLFLALILLSFAGLAPAQTTRATQPFDGAPWNISTGNLSTHFIQASPIGAHPRPGVLEPPPTVEAMKRMKADGLVAYEDYVAWGAVEREPGKWEWSQHDAVADAVHAAGLKYVVYNWVHFPPVWLRDQQKSDRTLMRCLEHDRETNYLSIFDPRTIEHYDRFYKHLAEHFGEKIDGVYACILGPYGEGNYPLYVPDWINIGHCHEGYWCGDPHARRAFREAMRETYRDIAALNRAWATQYKSFDDLQPPKQATIDTLRIHPDLFITPGDRHRWIDFIAWYHQAMIDFTEQSISTTLKYFPAEKVRTKPGGNAGGVNPIAWGTYCPGYAKMARKFRGVVLQPADWHGAYFGDKWVATAYHFYGVPLSTEPAGGLDDKGFIKRLFSDISCGTRQLFTYDFDKHSPAIRKYAHLITGRPGETEIAVLCPTTLYRLGGNLQPTIAGANKLRDLADFEVLDELLILDGALKTDRYKLLVAFQADWVDQGALDAIGAFMSAGGKVLIAGKTIPQNLDGQQWTGQAIYAGPRLFERFARLAAGMKGFDGVADGIWQTRRGDVVFALDTTNPSQISASEFITVAPGGAGFVTAESKRPFIPWGFNYDRDNDSKLLESYWHDQWPRVVEDFQEMKQLGANVVRVHLQFGAFMEAADKPNEKNFAQLDRLIRLAEEKGLYLDLTGLACYRKQDMPPWYDKLDEAQRWDTQSAFWAEVARRCADRPGVFCYDLMNEPVAPPEKQPPGQWLHPQDFAGFYFVQYIALDPAGRSRDEIFRAWTRKLSAAIRKHDKRHPITIGMLPFAPGDVAKDLDFLSVHIYPNQNKVDESIQLVKAFNEYAKPIVIEEMFPLSCDAKTLGDFITRSRAAGADGWIGFYWGNTPQELKASKNISDHLTLGWLELFQAMHPNRSADERSGPGSTQPARR